nr:hypothetical protein [Tanacetum cinerariifolium]
MMSKAIPSEEINETGINMNETPIFEQDVHEKPHDVGVKNKSLSIPERTTQPLVKPQQSSIPFLNQVRKEKEKAQQQIFLKNLKQLHINISFIESLVQMPKYAKYLKSLLTNKSRLEEACKMTMNERCSAVLLNKLPSKEKDPGSFTIPCQVSHLQINNALADLGASITLMPYTMYEKLDKRVLPIDFVILDMPKDSSILIILGRPFLAIARAMIDVFNKNITLRVGDDEVIFDMDPSTKKPPTEDDECHGIDDLDDTINIETQELLKNDQLDLFLLKGLEKSINQSDLESNSIEDKFDNNSDVDLSIHRINPINMSYSKAQETEGTDRVKNKHLYSASTNEIDKKKHELEDFPSPLEYPYLHGNKSFPIIISSKLSEEEKISLLQVLKKHKGAEDLAVYHLSRLENSHMEVLTEKEITDEFPDKHLMLLNSKFNDDEPWYAYFINYIIGKVVPPTWTFKKGKRVGEVAYRLELPEELKGIHNTFHVSNLRKCLADEFEIVSYEELQVNEKLHYDEEPIQIIDRKIMKLRSKQIPFVKVEWQIHRGPQAT